MHIKIKCPYCKKSSEWNDNPFRPFCSERCKLLDLNNWFEEKYTMPSVESEQLESEESPEIG